MRSMRSDKRVVATLALCAAAAAFAAPAFAAPAEAGVEARFGVARVAGWAGETSRKQRALAEGPFMPVVGPVDYGTAENSFGAARSGHVHAGQDMFAKPGTPLIAAADAVVVDAGSDGGQGNYVHLYDRRTDRTYVYMHMIEPARVRTGDRVQAGEQLGGVGCTGSCWGDHLHFEVRDGRGFDGEPRDPMPLLEDWRSLDEPV
jgi:murein DD-endopeptidase MepM/ murein hydrolase activator NlpD